MKVEKKQALIFLLFVLLPSVLMAGEVSGRILVNRRGRVFLALNQGQYVPDGQDPDFGFQADIAPSDLERGWIEFTFNEVPPGDYVLQGFVDTNGNGVLDIGMFGPTEPYGFSNKAKGVFGMPSWDQVKFAVDENGANQELDFR